MNYATLRHTFIHNSKMRDSFEQIYIPSIPFACVQY